jgi:DNA replication protein DnaC
MSFEQIIDAAEKAAAENIKAEQGDFIHDGLLHCGKCKTPKQCRVNILGKERTPYCLCKCETEKRDREEAERKRAERERKAREMRRVGFPDSDMQKWTFANDDLQNPRITQAMQKYVENFPELRKKGQGLLLYGTVGTGKTYAAAEVANALIDKGYSALVTNFARIANTVGGMYGGKQDYYDSLNRFDLLVIDDLAAERKTEYMQEIVYNVIDSRYRAGLPMIITTNLTAEELKNPQDITNKRIFDRVMERCLPIEVAGRNRRHQKTAASFSELNSLLGL